MNGVPAELVIASFAAMREGVVVLHAGGEIAACNPAAERILGLTRDQMAGRTSFDPRWQSIHEDGSPFPGESHPATMTLRTGQPRRDVVMGVHRPDGTLCWISINSEPVPGPDGHPSSVVVTFVDVSERKRAELALRESESEFRRIVETANEGIWRVDSGSKTSFVNRRLAEMLGYSPEEIVGRPPRDFVVEEERADVDRRMAVATQGLADSYDRCFLRKDGSKVWTHLKSSPVRSLDGTVSGLLAMVSDITERKEAEEATRRSEENLRSFFEAIDDCMFVLDGTGTILHVNGSTTARLGWAWGELVGKNVLFVHPEERREEAARIVQAMVAGTARCCPVPLLTKSGKRIPVETRVFAGRWDGRDVLFGLSKDLSELHASAERFEKAFRHNPSPMVIRSIPTGKIVDVNRAFTETLGYRREDVVGKTSVGIGAATDAVRQKAAEELLRSEGSFRDFEMEARTADGQTLHGLFSGEVIELQDERLLLTVMKDVTELRNAQTELRRHRDHLEELVAERTASLLRTETELRDSEERLRLAQQVERSGTFEWNIRTSEVVWTPELRQLYGLSGLESVPDSGLAGQLVHPDDRTAVREAVERAVELRSGFACEFRVLRADGETRWMEGAGKVFCDDTGQPVRVIGVNRDVTERRQAEAELRSLHAELERRVGERTKELADATAYNRSLIEASLDPLVTVGRDGRVTDVNEATIRATGFPRDELVGTVYSDYFVDPEKTRTGFERVFQDGVVRNLELGLKHRDGSAAPVECNAAVYRDAEGRVAGVFAAARDVADRKRFEEALKRSEARFRTMFERHGAVMLLIEPDSGRIVDANDAAAAFYGYDRPTLRTMNVLEINTLSREEVAAERRRAAEEKLNSFVFPHRLASGSLRTVEVHSSPIELDGTRILFSIIHDVTERRKAELALLESEGRFREVLESSAGASYKRDLRADRYAYMSPVVERISGYTPAELRDLPIESVLAHFHPADRAEVERVVAGALSSRAGTPFQVTYRFRQKSGAYRCLQDQFVVVRDALGRPSALIGSVSDITEKKVAEDALVRAEEQLRTFFDLSPVGKAIATPDGRFLRVNEAYCGMLGLSQDELRPLSFRSLLHPDDLEASDAALRSVLDGTTEGVDLDVRHVAGDGRVVWTHVRGAVLRDAAGNPSRLMVHVLDISQRKAAELALRQSHEQLEERVAERTSALVEANRELEGYSYSVSHELRTPLRAIDGHSAMVAADYSGVLDDDGQRHLAQLRWNAQRMGRLIDDLLVFSRTGRTGLAFEAVDMTWLATEAFAAVVSDFDPASRTVFSVGALPDAVGDAGLLRQVWENLLSNAVKFSAKREWPQVRVEGRVEGGELVYRVLDNGVGFDMRHADKLFGVFQRLHGHRDFEGTGVGLALVRRIVGRHGGRAWAKGELDRGAEFSFSLPPKGPSQTARP